jgi:Tfp pilus assembly protein PilX
MSQSKIRSNLSSGQAGIVLPIALVVLVAMTLSALALIRSVNMSTLVAGNMAFRESAVLSAERSTETVLEWLVAHSEDGVLHENSASDGYRARRDPPENEGSPDWDAYWNGTLAAQAKSGGSDEAGNSVSYVIHRLCDSTGKPTLKGCSKPPINNVGNSHLGGSEWPESAQVYYRITTRVAGPRYTVVYTQTIIAI